MGVIKHFSSSSYDYQPPYSSEEKVIKVESTPNPSIFKLVNLLYVGEYMILKVHYPDSTNYEGLKILVYDEGIKYNELLATNKDTIDPHFAENKNFISPIARFEPTERGWEMAIEFCKSLNN